MFNKAICNGWMKCKLKILFSLLHLPAGVMGQALAGRFGHGGQLCFQNLPLQIAKR